MTVSTTNVKNTYDGDDVTTNWPITFSYDSDSEIVVVITDSDGVETTLSSDYTVEISTDPLYPSVDYPSSGSLVAVLPTGSSITIHRVKPLTQAVDWTNRGNFNATILEGAIDKLTMISQEIQEQVNRCIKYALHESPTTTETDAVIGAIELAKTDAEAAQAAAEVAKTASELAETNAEAAQVAAEAALASMSPISWTTATRPAGPATGRRGFNTSFGGTESWNGTAWLIESGVWTFDTRPETTLIAIGSHGYNSELPGIEAWDGSEWSN